MSEDSTVVTAPAPTRAEAEDVPEVVEDHLVRELLREVRAWKRAGRPRRR